MIPGKALFLNATSRVSVAKIVRSFFLSLALGIPVDVDWGLGFPRFSPTLYHGVSLHQHQGLIRYFVSNRFWF